MSNLSETHIGNLDVKSSREKFYDFFMNQYDLIPSYSARTTKSLRRVESEETTPSSLVYTTERFITTTWPEQKFITMIERIEEDKENNSLIFTVIGGDLLQDYNSIRSSFQVITPEPDEMGEDINRVKIVIECEKKHENVTSADSLDVMMIYLTQDIDAFLTPEPEEE